MRYFLAILVILFWSTKELQAQSRDSIADAFRRKIANETEKFNRKIFKETQESISFYVFRFEGKILKKVTFIHSSKEIDSLEIKTDVFYKFKDYVLSHKQKSKNCTSNVNIIQPFVMKYLPNTSEPDYKNFSLRLIQEIARGYRYLNSILCCSVFLDLKVVWQHEGFS